MILELDEVSHRYGTEQALEDVSFGLESGELVAVLGPSGCGKTTVVQVIAGHVTPTAGRVLLRSETVTDSPPEARRVGVVFQQPTLFPHMTVRENVTYGLAPVESDPDRRAELVERYLQLVDLWDQRDARPSTLSGGQKRRAELARALAPEPDVLLLDEPLSALDRALREQLRDEIGQIQRETGVTTLFVTHDQEDALALADRIVVMSEGEVAGIGRPRALYRSPPNQFVASFLGRSNTLPATVVETDPPTVRVGEDRLRVEDATIPATEGEKLTCHLRPTELSLANDETDRSLSGAVVNAADVGRRYDVTVRLPTGEDVVVEQSESPPATGSETAIAVPEGRMTLFAGGQADPS
jgi:ABC-type Fe3+/spermidine/putrescine transport system ATPase subunit